MTDHPTRIEKLSARQRALLALRIQDALAAPSDENAPGVKRLVAYVVADPEQTEDADELRTYLKDKLPDVMVPSEFVFLPELPRMPNGKVDRQALPAPEHVRPSVDQDYEPPTSPMEKALAEIWGQLLGVDEVSIHDNFYELGGHSLLSMQAIARIEKSLAVRVTPGELMWQSLGQIASLCDQRPSVEPNEDASLGQKLSDVIKKAIFDGS